MAEAKARCCDCRKVFDDADLLAIKQSSKRYFDRIHELLDYHTNEDHQEMLRETIESWKKGCSCTGFMEGAYLANVKRTATEKFPNMIDDWKISLDLSIHSLQGELDIRSEAVLFKYLLAMDQPPEMRTELEQWTAIVPMREMSVRPLDPIRWSTTLHNIRMYDILP